ncbi:MAG: peptide-methionine (R)-S-oxide reductase MsrB [Ilumatobacteraceae bacterium]
MAERPIPTDEELREKLSPLQYEVTQKAATERAFSGVYWDTTDEGTYHCVVCDEPLFTSDTKYDAGCGWPSFTEAIDSTKIDNREDRSHGMVRVETVCSNCGAHLGHVFPDGPGPTGDRFCMNSASLDLKPADADDQ